MIINGEITSLHISFTKSHVEGPFMTGSQMLFAISLLSTAAIEKEKKQEKSEHKTSESSSLLQNKINNSTLEEGNAHIPFKFTSEWVGLFASIHSLTSVRPHGVRICACVSHIRYHSLVCFGGVESIFKTCENCECLWVENVQVCPYCEVSTHSKRVSCEFSSVRDVSPDESPHLNESEPKSAAPYWGCDATTHCPPSPHLLLHHQRGREKHRKSTRAS